jgi:hypothetical protein
VLGPRTGLVALLAVQLPQQATQDIADGAGNGLTDRLGDVLAQPAAEEVQRATQVLQAGGQRVMLRG